MGKKKLIGIIGACIIVIIVVLVIATRPIPTYTLSLTVNPSGAGSVSPSGGEYESGSQITLTASPDSGYQFVNWTGDVGTIVNVNAASTIITMTDSYSITANFEQIPPGQVDLIISRTTGGSVTAPGEGTFSYDQGATVTLVASPASGYQFVNWTGDVGTIVNVNAASTIIAMNDDYEITANFGSAPSTPVGGILSDDVTWTLAESPYMLTGHILIPEGNKLTVEPGVQVTLADRFIQVEGTLQVLGTSQQPVKITADVNTSNAKLIFKANSIGWDEDTQTGSIIRNAIIEGQTYGSTLIEIEDSSPKIVDSTIINTNWSGGVISMRGSPKIISNRISGYYGLAVRSVLAVHSGFPQIIGNRIEGENSFTGISLSLRNMGESAAATSHVRIEGNLITGFEYGILVQAFNDNDQIDITSNHITSNQVGILTGIYEGDSSSPPLSIGINAIHNNHWNAQAGSTQGKAYDVDMSNNWWGTTDSVAIEAKLYHYPQDFRLSRIVYEPFLTEMPGDISLP